MSASDFPRPTSPNVPPSQTRFTASLDKLSSTTRTSNNGNGRSKLPGGIAFPDLPLKSLHTLLTEVITTTLPSALSLFLIVYLSSPHTRTDGLRGYVPVGVILGRIGGEVGRRRLGLGSSGGLGAGAGEYGLDGRGEEMGGLNDSNSGGDDEEKQNIDTNTNTDIGTTSTSVSSSPSTSPSSSTPTRFRGRKAEILSGALEAALALGLSMAVSGNESGSGGVGLGLLVSSWGDLCCLVVCLLLGGFTVVVLFVERGRA